MRRKVSQRLLCVRKLYSYCAVIPCQKPIIIHKRMKDPTKNKNFQKKLEFSHVLFKLRATEVVESSDVL